MAKQQITFKIRIIETKTPPLQVVPVVIHEVKQEEKITVVSVIAPIDQRLTTE